MTNCTSRFISALVALSLFEVDHAIAITIPMVAVGNAGNAPDLRYPEPFDSNGVGAVRYDYRIGTTEVSNAQYAAFLNGVDPAGANRLTLYNPSWYEEPRDGIALDSNASDGMKYFSKPGRENKPVVFVTWYSALRFVNWLHNGQSSGDTETGAYTLLGGSPQPTNGNRITRNADARWWLPSEDEWYKAAYHKNDGVTGNYWDYPTSSDTPPYSAKPPGNTAPDPSNVANWYRDDGIANGYDDGGAASGLKYWQTPELANPLTDVAAYANAKSPYGTFDQGGNSFEWTEDYFRNSYYDTDHIVRGGYYGEIGLSARERYVSPISSHCGFRVAAVVPEPGACVLLCLVLLLLSPRTAHAIRFKS